MILKITVNAYYWKDLNKSESINVFDVILSYYNDEIDKNFPINFVQLNGVTLTTLYKLFPTEAIKEAIDNFKQINK